MMGSADCKGVCAYLVGSVTIGCDAVRPDYHRIHPPLCHQRCSRRVHNERGRQPVMDQLICSQPGPCAPRSLLTTSAFPLQQLRPVLKVFQERKGSIEAPQPLARPQFLS